MIDGTFQVKESRQLKLGNPVIYPGSGSRPDSEPDTVGSECCDLSQTSPPASLPRTRPVGQADTVLLPPLVRRLPSPNGNAITTTVITAASITGNL
jgi:hypothetical protein